MTNTSMRRPLLVLAMIFAMTLAGAAWITAAAPVYADGENEISKICFDGDSDYDWYHLYHVDNVNEFFQMDDLNITVLDGAGNVIHNPGKFVVVIERVYHDEEQREDVRVRDDGPYDIKQDDRGIGFTEYVATATAVDGSGYEGQCEGSFFVIDRHTLNHMGSSITFNEFDDQDGWRMHHDRYWFWQGMDITPKVTASDGEELTEEDYSIEYYKRSGSPEDMDDPDVDIEDILVADPELKVTDVPTEPGGYFARITGTGDYYGTNDVLIDIREDEYEIDLPENDRILPGWGGWLDSIHAFVRDANHPDGEEMDLPIKYVEIIEQDPDNLLTLEECDGEWEYRADRNKNELGEARLQVTYNDPFGYEQTCEFKVFVCDTVYQLDMWTVEGIKQGLPGTDIDLEAYAEKKWVDWDDERGEWNEDCTSEYLGYDWSLTDGEEYATITQDPDDQTKARVTFKDMPADKDWLDERVEAKVTVNDEDPGDPQEECSARTEELWAKSDFYQIYPALLDDPDLDVGQSTTIEPELRYFEYGQEGYKVIDAEYRLEDYDDNAVKVDVRDGVFTITRKTEWDTEMRLEAEWDEERWRGYSDQRYHLNSRDYWVGFDRDDYDIYEDQKLLLRLEKENMEGLDKNFYDIEWSVGKWDDGEEQMDPIFEEYTVDSDGISIDGEAVESFCADNDVDGLNIHVRMMLGDREICDSWCWLNLRESCEKRGEEHKWYKFTVKEATLDAEGLRYWVCPEHSMIGGCGEFREEVIPKKIDIAKATIAAIKTVTYNKKAQKPAVTVKYDGKTLKAGTDYSIAYVNNINAGKATVVLVGKDRFAGDKNATFTIAKANNPIKVSVKKPSVKFTAVKKKNQTIKQKAAYTVSGNQGKVTWKKASGNAKITVAANGNITVKKGLKKGTYAVKVKATAAGNANYKSATKTVTVKVAVK